MQSKDDLTDLRFAAAIAQTGSLSGAARRLGVSHATAFRRIEAFEARLGVKLFERSAGRYVPTVAGEELARAGAQIELEATESLRKVAGRDLRPTGHVRVTTTDSFANGLIAPMAHACREMNPGIVLQVIASNEIYSLTKRDADIAIRPTKKPPEYLIGKKAGIVAMAVYGEKNYLRRHARKSLEQYDWIAAGDSSGNSASLGWIAKIKPLDEVAYRTNSFTGVSQACAAGIGLAILPCFIGDRQPGLKRVTPLIEECTIDLWILTHPDLRNTVRVKTVFQAFHHELRKAAPLLAGRQPQGAKR
ncbi:MAG: LysR family transcriptional regulator [Burkholderiales bacterium]